MRQEYSDEGKDILIEQLESRVSILTSERDAALNQLRETEKHWRATIVEREDYKKRYEVERSNFNQAANASEAMKKERDVANKELGAVIAQRDASDKLLVKEKDDVHRHKEVIEQYRNDLAGKETECREILVMYHQSLWELNRGSIIGILWTRIRRLFRKKEPESDQAPPSAKGGNGE